MHDDHKIIPVDAGIAARAHITKDGYAAMYKESIEHPEVFWGKQAETLKWIAPWSRVKNASFEGNVDIRWFEGGKINIAENCIDRHLPQRANQTAFIWEADDPSCRALRTAVWSRFSMASNRASVARRVSDIGCLMVFVFDSAIIAVFLRGVYESSMTMPTGLFMGWRLG